MGSWPKNTPWRQGYFLCQQATLLVAERGQEQCTDCTVALMITHDCDCARNENQEPKVELILGRLLQAGDGNHRHGKNPRILHLPIIGQADLPFVELNATKRVFIPKTEFSDFKPNEQYRLEERELRTLQSWLAARYRRSSFPDEFNRRLASLGVFQEIDRALRDNSKVIHAVLFDLNGSSRAELPEGMPYILDVVLVYTVHEDADAESKARDIQKALEGRLNQLCDGQGGEYLELASVTIHSYDAIPWAIASSMQRYDLDTYSLRNDQDVPE